MWGGRSGKSATFAAPSVAPVVKTSSKITTRLYDEIFFNCFLFTSKAWFMFLRRSWRLSDVCGLVSCVRVKSRYRWYNERAEEVVFLGPVLLGCVCVFSAAYNLVESELEPYQWPTDQPTTNLVACRLA